MGFSKHHICKQSRLYHFCRLDNSGFTIVELLAVIVLISIISAVVVSRFYFSDSNLEAQTEAIKVYLRYAQVRSMNTESVWGINCNENVLYLYRYDPETESEIKILLPGEDGVDASLDEKGISMDPFMVSFNSWGKPCTDAVGVTEALEDIDLTVSSGSVARNITITKNTGFIP